MSVVFVVMFYKVLRPLPSFPDTDKAVPRIQAIAAVLKRAKEGLRIRVVTDSRTAVREDNSVLLKQSHSGHGFHARTIV